MALYAEGKIWKLGDNSPQICHVSAHLGSKFLIAVFFSPPAIYSKVQCLSLWSKGQEFFLSIIKASSFLISGFLFFNIIHCEDRYCLTLFVSIWVKWGFRNWHTKNADALALVFALSNKLSSGFVPGVSHSLPATMKLYQANIIDCK